jgi:4-hydroxy-tetrahydrodipicolinate reductase
MSNIHIIVVGASGRMGQAIASCASTDPSITLIAGITRAARDDANSSTRAARDTSASLMPMLTIDEASRDARLHDADVIIDFSSNTGLSASMLLASRCDAALLVGTTGLSQESLDALQRHSASRAVMVTPNTSLGVAAVAMVARDLAKRLGPAYRASIVESHHIHKKDAPSGTAKKLAQALRDGGNDLSDDQIHAIRAGDIVGTHTIMLAGLGEVIELTHRATTRNLFAFGALRCAAWLSDKPAGMYSMEDMLVMGR